MFSQVCVCPQEGEGVSQAPRPPLVRTGVPPPPWQDRGTPPSPLQPDRARTAVRRGRYAFCVRAGGLSCIITMHLHVPMSRFVDLMTKKEPEQNEKCSFQSI